MNHILTNCTTDPVRIIWPLAQNLWPHNPELWPNISLGLILAGGNIITLEDDDHDQSENEDEDSDERAKIRSIKQGKDCLLQILITEFTHLIWVLRCDQVINNHTHTLSEIRARWLKVINARLTDDKIIATKIC